jgi:hypothetical protein
MDNRVFNQVFVSSTQYDTQEARQDALARLFITKEWKDALVYLFKDVVDKAGSEDYRFVAGYKSLINEVENAYNRARQQKK